MSIDLDKPFRRLAPSTETEIDAQTGRATFIFNTEDVGRDGHIVRNAGIRTANFDANPTILFAHDDRQPPIGRATAVRIGSPASKVEIEFTPREVYPFGATIGDLVKARYLNACSMSWQPIKWRFRDTKDGMRGGVIFDEVDLLEISIVPVPALPEAIATARSHGIDTSALFQWAERLLDTSGIATLPRIELETLRRAAKMPARSESTGWKVGVSRDLPVEDSDSWDGAAAEASVFEWAGGDKFDPSKARKAFLVYSTEKPEERGSYKLPIAHAVDGELKVPKGAIRAAASRLPDTDIPDDVKKRAGAVLDGYKKKAGIGEDDGKRKMTVLRAKHALTLARAPSIPAFRRGLCEVAQLAYSLHCLGYLHDATEYEADVEGDDSKVPAMLGEALKALGEALIAMTQEEVTELLDGVGDDEVEVEVLPEERSFVKAAPTGRSRAWRIGIACARAGKVLSKSNRGQLEDADAHQTRALKQHETATENHAAVGAHLAEATKQHERASETLDELGEHVRAAQENPDDEGHLERAVKSHKKASEQMGAVADAHDDAAEAHEDQGDSQQSTGRSVKRAQRCVRSVLDTSSPTDDEDEDDTPPPKSKKQDEDEERAFRERLAKAIKLRGDSL